MAIAGYRNFATGRVLLGAVAEAKDQLQLIRAKAIHGEKPDTCDQLLYYEVSIVSGGESGPDKIIGIPFCSNGAGTGQEYSIEKVSLTTPSGWPVDFMALTGTIAQKATLNLAYRGSLESITINILGTIE